MSTVYVLNKDGKPLEDAAVNGEPKQMAPFLKSA